MFNWNSKNGQNDHSAAIVFLKDWLFNKMYFHRILASAIMWYVFFFVILNLLLPQPWHVCPRWEIPLPVCGISGSAPHSFPMTNNALKDLVSVNPGFSKNCWNFVSSCYCPLRVRESSLYIESEMRSYIEIQKFTSEARAS